MSRTDEEILAGLIPVTPPEIKGAHDAEMVLVGDRAFIVSEVNELRSGEGAGWPEIYALLSVVSLSRMKLEKTIPFARSEQQFPSETLSPGACFVPRIIQKDADTLRCFFTSEQPKVRQSQMYFRDFHLDRMEFASDIGRVKLKTQEGIFEMQPEVLHADAVRSGFRRSGKTHGLFIFDSFKKFEGRTYVAINNFASRQNALAVVNDALDTFEVIGHYNDPEEFEMSESSVNRLPDGTWMAICRCDAGDKNYRVTTSKDGRQWTAATPLPFITNGTNSKPTFNRFGDLYYLGWQEDSKVDDAHRSVFNIDVSPDGKCWRRQHRFATRNSFQYPSFHAHEDQIWMCVTQGDSSPTRKERIMFGLLGPVDRNLP